MILNTLPKKSVLALLLTYSSVIWLNKWHQYVYTRSRIDFPPVSNWLRDSMIVFIPVMLAVWMGIAFMQWLINRSKTQMSPSTQSTLTAATLAGVTTFVVILMETSRVFQTGIGYEFIFLASICNRVYPNGNLLLSIIKWMVPGTRALRYHILLQDGINLILLNLSIIIFLIIIMEGIGLVRTQNSFAQETVG